MRLNGIALVHLDLRPKGAGFRVQEPEPEVGTRAYAGILDSEPRTLSVPVVTIISDATVTGVE
jgi:hypothetical protein